MGHRCCDIIWAGANLVAWCQTVLSCVPSIYGHPQSQMVSKSNLLGEGIQQYDKFFKQNFSNQLSWFVIWPMNRHMYVIEKIVIYIYTVNIYIYSKNLKLSGLLHIFVVVNLYSSILCTYLFENCQEKKLLFLYRKPWEIVKKGIIRTFFSSWFTPKNLNFWEKNGEISHAHCTLWDFFFFVQFLTQFSIWI